MQLKASAPGSLMLLGEYAVLHGHPALVCAINQRLTVLLTPHDSEKVVLSSDRYATYQTTKTALHLVDPYRFVLAALQQFAAYLPSGCALHIESTFSDQVGFGSSAALVSASLAALNEWLRLKLTPIEMISHAVAIIRAAQNGRGSGADAAASILGGMVSYQMEPLSVHSLRIIHPLVACYSGFKTKTPVAIQIIESTFELYPALLSSILQAIGNAATAGIKAVQERNWHRLGEIMTIQQALMTALQVNLPILQRMVDELNNIPSILGAKISGAGLGDCVIGLGNADLACMNGIDGASYIPIEMSLEGVTCERNE